MFGRRMVSSVGFGDASRRWWTRVVLTTSDMRQARQWFPLMSWRPHRVML